MQIFSPTYRVYHADELSPQAPRSGHIADEISRRANFHFDIVVLFSYRLLLLELSYMNQRHEICFISANVYHTSLHVRAYNVPRAASDFSKNASSTSQNDNVPVNFDLPLRTAKLPKYTVRSNFPRVSLISSRDFSQPVPIQPPLAQRA